MTDTETLITLLENGPVAALNERLDADPRRVNTFLSRPAPHGPEQWMPLHLAAHAGLAAAVDALLNRGVHPDCRTRFTTPMHARQTALHLAAAAGHDLVLERLLEADAEVEVRDAQQRSPLWLAARHGHAGAARQLLGRGADPETRDTQGRTPLHAALLPPPKPGPERSEDPAPATAWSPAAALALLDAGADPNATCPKDPDGFTPLHRCVGFGDVGEVPGFVVELLTAGADTTLADPRFGRTARDLAEHLGHTELARLLDAHA